MLMRGGSQSITWVLMYGLLLHVVLIHMVSQPSPQADPLAVSWVWFTPVRKPTALAASPRHTPRSAAHTAVCPRSVCAAGHHWVALLPFPQLSSAGRFPTAPTPQQAADYTQLRRSLSALPQRLRTLPVVVAAYCHSKALFFSVYEVFSKTARHGHKQRKGAAAPQKSRVSASLRSIPPLSLRNGQALDFFHPAYK
jgi:hypothetical protein